VFLQKNNLKFPPLLPQRNNFKTLNLANNPLKIAPNLTFSPVSIKVCLKIENLTLIASLMLKKLSLDRGDTLNSRKGADILPLLTVESITSDELCRHFSSLLKPAESSFLFYAAVILAAQEHNLIVGCSLPVALNARILSFLYQQPTKDAIKKEENNLLSLFPSQARMINSFISSGAQHEIRKNYDHISLATLAEKVVANRCLKFTPFFGI